MGFASLTAIMPCLHRRRSRPEMEREGHTLHKLHLENDQTGMRIASTHVVNKFDLLWSMLTGVRWWRREQSRGRHSGVSGGKYTGN